VVKGDKPSLRILEELSNLSMEDFQEEMKKYESYKEDILLYLKHKANELEFQLNLQNIKQKD
jgi:hypothetical protein